jgi:hypothetical protein
VRARGLPGTYVASADAARNGHEAPIEAVLPLVPAALPPSDLCGGRAALQLERGGDVIRYGECSLTDSLRALQLAVVAEAGQWSTIAPRTVIAGGSARERAAIRRVVRSLGRTHVRRVRVVPRGEGVALKVTSDASLRGEWETSLLASAYAAYADRDGLRAVGWVDSQAGGWQPGAAPDATFATTALRHVARAWGIRVVELRRQAGAVSLMLRTDDPALFLHRHGRALVRMLRGKRRTLPVSGFAGIEDGAGVTVYAFGWLPAEGMMFTRPDLDACGPIVHSMPVGAPQLPCAAG